jgi:type I restriction enzyme S subunit
MIDGLRPYVEMKPTGLPWLEELPAGWEIHRAKYSFVEVNDRSVAGDEELLSVSHKTGVTPRSQKNITMFMAESYEGHKVCRPGDVVVNTMWAWMAAIGVSRHTGIVSPAYGIYRPRASDRFEPRFLDYLLRTESYRAEYVRSSRGVTMSRLRLYPPDFLNIPFVQPSLEEQRLILRFLDWHGGQVARLVRAKKALIGLLNEQKQAIIHRAVTRGLDPNAELKPSGVTWLGDVPEEWEVKPVFACFSEKNTKNRGMVETTVLSLSYGRIIVKPLEKLRGLVPESFETYQIIDSGNIIVRSTDLQNDQKSLRVGIARDRGIITSAYMCLRPKGDMTSEFGYQILNTYDLLKIIYGYGSGLRQNLGFADIRRMPVPLPPPGQQNAIVEYLNHATKEASMAIEHIGYEISLIQEFRTRMISDVVTGKLDVRALAATLPEIAGQDLINDLAEDEDLDDLPEDTDTEEAAA